MSFVMPEVAVQRVIQAGIQLLRERPGELEEIFDMYLLPDMRTLYGQERIEQIRTWFDQTQIPVLQAWSLNDGVYPCYSICLSSDVEDETKAAINDYFGSDDDQELKVGVFTSYVTVGIHGTRESDMVLWLYYILAHILFKLKPMAEGLGVQLHTWSAGDYFREDIKLPNNIWSRSIKFKCTTENIIPGNRLTEIENIGTGEDNPVTFEPGE